MKITIGALAHVDAGKTSLAETILYKTNTIRKIGRVDHKDSFLDFNNLEKEKGITVFNKQANFVYKDKEYIYLDTPGHSDLAYESNRAIKILDCAILIISAIDQIPSDTIAQFNNLLNYNIPILVFINKMDITPFDKETILNNIKNNLSNDCIMHEDTIEHISLLDDALLDEYLKTNTLKNEHVFNCLKNNYLFPCFFGSCLKQEGIDELLEYIYQYIEVCYDEQANLNTYLYKINNEYSYLKVLSGTLNNKTIFNDSKINEMYYVNGNNYTPISSAKAGDIVAVKGLKDIPLGTYLPSFNSDLLYEVPSLTYRIISNKDPNELYKKLENITYEFPELKIRLNNHNIFINLNGELHSLIIKNLIKERLDEDVDFSSPIIKYKETIDEEVYGVGHFEPLRHYGEVIVKIKPIEKGIIVNSLIDNSYTNTLVSYLRNTRSRGLLINAPLDNVEISIVDIKTHPKHTEGQDLIQSTRRAIRQALTNTKGIILGPLYLTSIKTNDQNINNIISYLSNNKCVYTISENTIITKISLTNFNDIITGLKSKLKGQIDFSIEDTIYEAIDNQEEIKEMFNYDYHVDLKNPAGSIFCKQGAGHYVEPEDVIDNMHLDLSNYVKNKPETSITHNSIKISDEELNRVWNNLYKPRKTYRIKKELKEINYKTSKDYNKPLLYLIDGYNLMYSLDEENAIANIISARENIINMVCDFKGYVNAKVRLVFDAYKTDNYKNDIINQDNIEIVYTKHGQSADNYIEQESNKLKDEYKIIVVTSDRLEQLRIFANNAMRISSHEFIKRYNNLKKHFLK